MVFASANISSESFNTTLASLDMNWSKTANASFLLHTFFRVCWREFSLLYYLCAIVTRNDKRSRNVNWFYHRNCQILRWIFMIMMGFRLMKNGSYGVRVRFCAVTTKIRINAPRANNDTAKEHDGNKWGINVQNLELKHFRRNNAGVLSSEHCMTTAKSGRSMMTRHVIVGHRHHSTAISKSVTWLSLRNSDFLAKIKITTTTTKNRDKNTLSSNNSCLVKLLVRYE